MVLQHVLGDFKGSVQSSPMLLYIHRDQVTMQTIWDREPWTTTLTFAQLLSSALKGFSITTCT